MNIKIISTIALLIIATSASTLSWSAGEPTDMPEKVMQSIQGFEWQHRIILIKEEVTCDEQVTATLLSAKAAIDERHILWFLICNEQLQTNYSGALGEQFVANTIDGYFIRDDVTVILIGKDGGIKRRTDSLNLDELFALIDSMPMRQSEINR